MNLNQFDKSGATLVRQNQIQGTVQASFIPASGFTPNEGQLVKLLADGTVTGLAAATDIPIGFVHVGYSLDRQHDVNATVGVKLFGGAKILARSAAAINAGTELAFSSTVTVGGKNYNKLAAATTGNYVVGIALQTTAAADNTFEVLVVNGIYKK